MPRAEGYRIVDEPVPSKWTHLAVSPTFPMFGFMLGGAWLGWAWFAVNAYAFGSATRRQEVLVALAAPVGAVLLFFALDALAVRGTITKPYFPYALLVVVLFKLATMYWLLSAQQRSFALYEYFGGRRRNASIVLVAALMFGRELVDGFPAWLRLVLQ